MANACSQHDIVDWLAALGPTLATVFAGIATILVYRRGEQLQRQLVRPLLAVRHHLNPVNEQQVRWIVEVKNEGQGAANIESVTVVAGEEILEPEPMQLPRDYWHGVLAMLDLLRFRISESQVIVPPLSMGSGANVVLFDALLSGERMKVAEAIKRLEIRIRYRSALGDTCVIHHRFGHTEAR